MALRAQSPANSFEFYSPVRVSWPGGSVHSMKHMSGKASSTTGINMVMDVPICSGRTAGKRNNLKVLYPDIAAEFDDKKNDGLLTEKIMPKSAKVYWWTCPRGTSYQLPVYRRTEGRGCTICVPLHTPISYPIFEAFVPKTNQEKISAQKIKDEWDFNKNIGVNLNQIKIMSEKMFWWRCPNNPDHSYQARFVTRIRGDGNCPTCRYLTEADNSVAKSSRINEGMGLFQKSYPARAF